MSGTSIGSTITPTPVAPIPSTASAASGTIRVIADGERRHRLEDASGVRIGWIRGQVIGFDGLRSDEEVIEAVAATWGAFHVALARHYFGWARRDVALDTLRIVHDGAFEWITDGVQPLARVRRPTESTARGPLALEYVLPSYATEGAIVAVAQVVGRALRAFLDARRDADLGAPARA